MFVDLGGESVDSVQLPEMSSFRLGLILFVVIGFTQPAFADGACEGDMYCTVCTDCSRCWHCSIAGQNCGVCSSAETPGKEEDGYRIIDGELRKIVGWDHDADILISEVTEDLSNDAISVEDALNSVQMIKAVYLDKVCFIRKTKNFDVLQALGTTAAYYYSSAILDGVELPPHIAENSKVRSSLVISTFMNLLIALTDSQLKRIDLLEKGLSAELKSGRSSAEEVYGEQLLALREYRKARAAVDTILASR